MLGHPGVQNSFQIVALPSPDPHHHLCLAGRGEKAVRGSSQRIAGARPSRDTQPFAHVASAVTQAHVPNGKGDRKWSPAVVQAEENKDVDEQPSICSLKAKLVPTSGNEGKTHLNSVKGEPASF